MIFSIIIPIYNREHTLCYCLEGVLNTTFDDFEIILIDDGSTDSSADICRKFSLNNSRIKILTQTNQGVSAARNAGIRTARGKYLLFCDSDDTYAPDALSIIHRNLDDEDLLIYDAVLCKYTRNQIKSYSHLNNPSLSSTFLKERSKIVNWLYDDYDPYSMPLFSVCNKVFRKDIILHNSIFFREDITIGEDQIFISKYLQCISSMRYIKTPLYHWISWPSSHRKNGSEIALNDPHKTLCNQIENYKALIDLYQETQQRAVKSYAVNYILDRPMTRIIYRHLSYFQKKHISLRELINFTKNDICPTLRKEYENIHLLRNRRVARHIHMLMKKQIVLFFFFQWIKINITHIKRKFFNLSKLKNKRCLRFKIRWLV